MIENVPSMGIGQVNFGLSDTSSILSNAQNKASNGNGSYDLLSKIEDHWKNNETSISDLLLNMDKHMENPMLFMAAMHHHSEFVSALAAAQGGIMSSIKTVQQTNG